ncbi:type IV pilus secretin PilQ, partial [Burkholderia sp. KCJ3K979]|nr:type IV pilus secretin PilQ [Burkholderia sp. KCJ3K979]
MTKHGCWLFAIWAGVTAADAGASLPPLPAVWPAGATDVSVPGLPQPLRVADGVDGAVAQDAGPPPFDQAARTALPTET